MRRVLHSFYICCLIFFTKGCRDTLWFQTSTQLNADEISKNILSNDSKDQQIALLRLGSRFVNNAEECARLCYVSMTPICGSALFENEFGSNSGFCRLLSWTVPCVFGRHLVSSVDQNVLFNHQKLLLHCFYCNPFADEGQSKTPNLGKDLIQKPFERSDTPQSIRVMTFNTWISGSNVYDGVSKIANNIFINDPDIVALQELDEYNANQILRILNSFYQQQQKPVIWNHCRRNHGGLNHIFTKFPVVQEYQPSTHLKNNGCQLKVRDHPAKYAQIWNVHLHWEDYGPYAACSQANSPSTNLESLLFHSEFKPIDPDRSRLHQTLRLLHNNQLKDFVSKGNSNSYLFVVGDFNSPSHLDWTRDAAHLHCNVSYEWPVSKLMTDFGYTDSFRKFHDDPLRQPGISWSPIYKTKTWLSPSSTVPEPQDRIDFIYYLAPSNDLTVKRSTVFNGQNEPNLFPYHRENDWPSDHAAVITDFEDVRFQG